jgi:hypothetical protein
MPTLIEDAIVKKAILNGLHVLDHSQAVFREPSPDGKISLVFFDAMDVAQGHGIWRSRFSVVDANNCLVREFGYRLTVSQAGVCAWAPDSKHAAIAMSGGVLVWRKGKFALVRVLSWDDSAALSFASPTTLSVTGFEWVVVRRGGADVGGQKTGKAEISLDQLEFYQESLIGSIEHLLNRQPILTPQLFVKE